MRDERPARVLVVDDQPYVREIICRCLEAEHHQCTCAANVQEAWGLLQGAEFDAVLTDIRMPGDSGMDLLAKIQAEMPHVAVVMVTASDDRQTAPERSLGSPREWFLDRKRSVTNGRIRK